MGHPPCRAEEERTRRVQLMGAESLVPQELHGTHTPFSFHLPLSGTGIHTRSMLRAVSAAAATTSELLFGPWTVPVTLLPFFKAWTHFQDVTQCTARVKMVQENTQRKA